MSSSLDLSARARLALAASLVITAWGLPRLPLIQRLAGGTAVPVAAGGSAPVGLVPPPLPLRVPWGAPPAARLVAPLGAGFSVVAVGAARVLFHHHAARGP